MGVGGNDDLAARRTSDSVVRRRGTAGARCCRVACVHRTSSTAPRWPLPCATSSTGWASRPARVALIIPDVAARVSVVRFEQVPQRREDLDQLVRWQVRKVGAVSDRRRLGLVFTGCAQRWTAAPSSSSCWRATTSSRDTRMSAPMSGCTPVWSTSLLSASSISRSQRPVQPTATGSSSTPGPNTRRSPSSAAGDLIYFRNRPEDDEESLTDAVHQTAMYYQDRLAGQGFARVLLGGISTAGELGQSLEERLGTPVESIDPTAAAPLSDRIAATIDVTGRAVAAHRRAAAHADRRRGDRLMLRINLATRPFYNVRVVQVVLGAACRGRHRLDGVQRDSDSCGWARASQHWAHVRRRRRWRRGVCSPTPTESANRSTRRNFKSWRTRPVRRTRSSTSAHFHGPTCWPSSKRRCRPTSASPPCSRGSRRTSFVVAIAVEARRSEDLDAFIEALEQRGAFHNVLSVQEQTNAERTDRGRH